MISNITINAPMGDLKGVMEVYGIVEPTDDNRLLVVYNGGSLIPASSVTTNDELKQLWKKTFNNAYATADLNRSIISRATRWAYHTILNLKPPTDIKSD